MLRVTNIMSFDMSPKVSKLDVKRKLPRSRTVEKKVPRPERGAKRALYCTFFFGSDMLNGIKSDLFET